MGVPRLKEFGDSYRNKYGRKFENVGTLREEEEEAGGQKWNREWSSRESGGTKA